MFGSVDPLFVPNIKSFWIHQTTRSKTEKEMKILVFLVSILAAIPLNKRTTVQKSCQTTCSGKSDNFVQFNSYALMLQGNS